MSLSKREMARLGELLDEAMTLTPEQRFVWLDSLPEQDQPLVKALRESLLSDDPDIVIGGALGRLPRIEATGAVDVGKIERRAGERLGAYELLQPLGAAAWPRCGWQTARTVHSSARSRSRSHTCATCRHR